MFRKLFGQRGNSQTTGTFYSPYKNDAANKIYKLLPILVEEALKIDRGATDQTN